MVICPYNVRKFPSEAYVENLMVQARKIKYDIVGLLGEQKLLLLHAVLRLEKNVRHQIRRRRKRSHQDALDHEERFVRELTNRPRLNQSFCLCTDIKLR
ncbi:hypothetical protein V3C99_012594 [Haemonchus contortus]|uniref:Transposase n=1 Tax=Haemonchus contortus TaxID=6289 RepID=A0A7I5E7A3_HAECO